MGQSLAQLHVHLVFGTKERHPLIPASLAIDFHSYVGGILRQRQSPALLINSMPDHVHILFSLSKNSALAKVVEEVKKQSSKWMKEQGVRGFSWQVGYGAFSVSSSKLETVKRYIQNQQEHHRHKTFKEEVEAFVEAYGVLEYDEEYFWR